MEYGNIPILFSLNATRELGEGIARYPDLTLSAHEERDFKNGEHKARPLVGGCVVVMSI